MRRNRGVKKRGEKLRRVITGVITFVEGVKSVASVDGVERRRRALRPDVLPGYFCEACLASNRHSRDLFIIANPLRYTEKERERLIFTGKSP